MTGYTLESRAERGESGEGAWYATDAQGRRVVVKWFRDLTALPRFEAIAGTLDALRARGYPAPEYVSIEIADDMIIVAQSRLEGRIDVAVNERTVADLLALNELQADVGGPTHETSWGDFMLHSLTVGEDGWCVHESMRAHSIRARQLVEKAEAIGAAADASWFPTSGIIHLDLHPGNFLLAGDGAITGVVDWEGAIVGDHRFDLTSFAFCTEVNGGTPALMAPVWEVLESSLDPRVMQAYAAHQAIRLVDWMIRHHPPAEVDRWLDAGERLVDRYS